MLKIDGQLRGPERLPRPLGIRDLSGVNENRTSLAIDEVGDLVFRSFAGAAFQGLLARRASSRIQARKRST